MLKALQYLNMKSIYFFITIMIFQINQSFAQVAINNDNSDADASAILDIKSTTSGLLTPRMTTTQRTSITSPALGLFVFDLTSGSFWLYNGNTWEELIENDETILKDNDGDTKIEVEANTDEDTIRFTLGGIEKMNMARTQIQLLDADKNTFIGYEAGNVNTGTNNTFLGYKAGRANLGGDYNTFLGFQAGKAHLNQDHNTYIGAFTGQNMTAGHRNTILGAYAGGNKTGGDNNTFIGYATGQNNATGANNVFIGYMAGRNETGSNLLYIDNSSTSTPLIYGNFATNLLTINGSISSKHILNNSWISNDGDSEGILINGNSNVGIGTNSLSNNFKLEVAGDVNISSHFEVLNGNYAMIADRQTTIAIATISSAGSIVGVNYRTNNISSVSKTATGTYKIDFVSGTFTDQPIVTATPYKVNTNTGYSAHIVSVSTSSITIKIYKHNGNAVDADFCFLAVGEL